MDWNELKTGIEKYWAGETSLQEERTIRQFFAEHPILPPDAEKYRKWFSGINGISHILDSDFDKRILVAIDGKTKGRAVVSSWRYWLAAAACLLLLVVGLRLNAFSTGKSTAYIDGKKYTNIHRIGAETLNSLNRLNESDDDVISSQIEALGIILEDDNNQ